jgi:hypothetical protein
MLRQGIRFLTSTYIGSGQIVVWFVLRLVDGKVEHFEVE